ncbi:DUF222 domain-containing protein [Demetria terragena]|uniref:HNH endonuclease signature motif containing protein n=1 Tax=Demetria terragena TaxID=63959 RepID=UPI00036DA5AD|nr:DUF222 domain-containing protein [Demetria terragena]
MEKVHPDREAIGLRDMIEKVIGMGCAPQDFDLITQIEQLQVLANAAQGAIARLSVDFDASQRVSQRQLGVRGSRVGQGVADQVALARKLSPSQASRDLGLAKALHDDLPRTADLFTRGVISAEVSHAVHRETAHLGHSERHEADARLVTMLPTATRRTAAAAARKVAYAIDPAGAVERAAKAAADRCVWSRPAPDTMCMVTALVPAARGVAAYAALRRDAIAIIAAGDPAERSMSQVMADLFVERATGQATAAGTPVEVQLVMTTEQLFGDAPPSGAPFESKASGAMNATPTDNSDPDGPSWLNGYGPVPAALARAVIAGVPDLLGVTPVDVDVAQAWVRRLFTDPATGQLTDLDGRRRKFDGTLRRFIRIRDQVCRIPFCDAPIRDMDHLRRHTDGGPTSIDNGAGVCQRFNHVKEIPGWVTEVIHDDDGDHDQRAGPASGAHPHTIRITTPTGKTYVSTSPPVQGTRASTPEPDTPAEVIRVKFADLFALAG